MESIGNRLRAAREEQGLSVEDAAHETRIQAIYIRGLENDDYSNFPSTTYAKSFLGLYSKFLEVDAGEALEQFGAGDSVSLSGHGYLESVTDNIEPRRPTSAYATRPSRPSGGRRSRPVRESSPGLAPVFLGLILVVLVVGIPTLWILGKDAQSIDEVASKVDDLRNGKLSVPSKPEEAETDAKKKPAEDKPGSPPPARSGPKPVKSAAPPKETKMAQVLPQDGERNLENSPGPAANPVVTGEKPKITPLPSRQARPAAPTVAEEKPTPEPANAVSDPSPPSRPLRAVPLIARPIIIPPEESDEEPEAETSAGSTEPESPEPRTDGNQFPRPLD